MSRAAGLVGRRVTVEVPATTANLGAGYDCLGLAIERVNRVELDLLAAASASVEATVELEVDGEGAGELPADRTNRFVAGFEAAVAAIDGRPPAGITYRIAMTNTIPLARGLGSSAAATVGGLVAANALLGGPLTVGALIGLAAGIEGHPDNAAAALLGGFVAVGPGVGEADPYEALRFDVPPGLRAVLFIPERRLETAAMRAALPEQVPLADAVANLGRVAIGVAGIAAGRTDVLAALTIDRLHEPYRAVPYPELPALVASARDAGAIGACLSGAGSTVVAFTDDAAAAGRIESAWRALSAGRRFPGRIVAAVPRDAGASVVAD